MVRRGDIWFANLPMKEDSNVQGGSRPVIILTNDVCNEVNTIVTVIPMTRQMKRLSLPTHVVITTLGGSESLVLAEQVMTIDKKLLSTKIGEISARQMEQIENAVMKQLGMSRKEEV